jgi:hypothetical protein
VIGELHVGGETFTQSRNMFSDPELFGREVETDLPMERIAPVVPAANASMLRTVSPASNVFEIEMGSTPSHRSRDHVLAVSDLVVARTGTGGVVRDRSGRHRFDIVAAFEHFLLAASVGHFQILAPQPHWPRVAIDRLVISRERWTFPAGDLSFAKESDATARLVGARRWAKAAGLPRYVFYKVPEEQKPFYLDLESPLFVDLFSKIVRGATVVHLSEMLPTPGQCWLADRDGERFVSELRLVAVDPVPYSAGEHSLAKPTPH